MSSNQESIELLCKAVDQAWLEPVSVPLDVIISRLIDVENKVLNSVAEEATASEVRRAIRETVFTLAIRRQIPLPECHKLFIDLCSVGFRHISEKCKYYVIFTDYCVEQGDENLARSLLSNLADQLRLLISRRSENETLETQLQREVEDRLARVN